MEVAWLQVLSCHVSRAHLYQRTVFSTERFVIHSLFKACLVIDYVGESRTWNLRRSANNFDVLCEWDGNSLLIAFALSLP